MSEFEDRLSGLGDAIGKGISVTRNLQRRWRGGSRGRRRGRADSSRERADSEKNTKRLVDAVGTGGLAFT